MAYKLFRSNNYSQILKKTRMDLKATYDKIAEDYYKDHLRDTWSLETIRQLIKLLKPGQLILDAGCGPGVQAKELTNAGMKVVGFDLSKGMIKVARRVAPQATFSVRDIRDVDRLKQQFDGIILQAVLLHIPKKEIPDILALLRKKLKPGGYLYVAVKEQRSDDPEQEVVTEDDYGYPYSRFFTYFSDKEMKQYLKDARLRIVYSEIRQTGRRNWINIIAKKSI